MASLHQSVNHLSDRCMQGTEGEASSPVCPACIEASKQKPENEGYGFIIRKLVTSSGIYAVSSVVSPLVSLLLAPFLTNNISRADYGALAIFTTFITLMSGVTQLGLNSAFFRAYEVDYESQRDRLDVVSTLSTLLILISLPIIILIALFAPVLSISLLNAPSFSNALRICAFIILMQNLTVPGLCWLRAENRALFFSIVTVINLLVSAGATILLVGMMHQGIEGALLATEGGYAVIVFATLPPILWQAGIRLRFDIARGMLLFGVPHVLNLLSAWILQFLDRYLLGLLGSLDQTASYAVAYSLGGALSALLIAPFSLAWWVIMYSIAKRADALRVFQIVFRWFCIVLLFAAFGLSIFGVILLDLFFPPAYHTAELIVPVIALSMVFNGVGLVVTIGIFLERKTWLGSIAFAASALVNTVLNLVFIPLYGAMGAALATLIAYAVLAFLNHIINQRLYPIPFEIDLFLIALLIGVVFYIGSGFLSEGQEKYIGWGISIGMLCLYGVCLVLLGVLSTCTSPRRDMALGLSATGRPKTL